jgi:2,3-bisphosphoglycerate-independent phosphoglycerate mutase
VLKNGPDRFNLTPPHDILERKISGYLPPGENGKILLDMMVESNRFLKSHPVNKARADKGLRPANSIWLWGEGRKPAIPGFFDKYGLHGSVISGVDLIKGIGICAGLNTVSVPGATGNINTNFLGKAEASLRELESGRDFVYVHIEAPDECGHRQEIENKVKSIEIIDEKVVGTILKGMERFDGCKIMLLPDHPTPLSLRTHTSEAVPFVIYEKNSEKLSGVSGYDEYNARESGFYVEEGCSLMDYFIKGAKKQS